jgi:hypothetical protein
MGIETAEFNIQAKGDPGRGSILLRRTMAAF